VNVFPLIGNHLVWYVGNGKQVRLGEDPWVGSRHGFKFPENMLNNLHDNGIFSLSDAPIPNLGRAGRTE